jgi:hypothetical protein
MIRRLGREGNGLQAPPVLAHRARRLGTVAAMSKSRPLGVTVIGPNPARRDFMPIPNVGI